MNSWSLLGIEPTTDTSVIRRAYKQQLLIYHPEDDPAGYQAIRKAYDSAMNYAKRQAKAAEDRRDTDEQPDRRMEAVEVVNAIEIEQETASAHDVMGHSGWEQLHVHEREFAVPIPDAYQARENFMVRVAALYDDPGKRNDPDAWMQLFGDDILWDIRAKSALDDALLGFFCEHYAHISNEIWTIIEANTGLLYKLTESFAHYPRSFVDTYVLAIQGNIVPSRQELASVPEQRVLKIPSAGFWRDCFGLPLTIRLIPFLLIARLWAIAGYILLVLVRIVLFIFRRNWKIIMGEYTFTYFNRLGRRYDFKYIDIAKAVQSKNVVTVWVRGKKIVMKEHGVWNLDRWLAKVSQYEKPDGSAILVKEGKTRGWKRLRSFFRKSITSGVIMLMVFLGVFLLKLLLFTH